MLRQDSGEMVGFFGFIPHDYIAGGHEVPSLLLTTSYVRKKNRPAALGLFLRANRQQRGFQLIDGGPSREAQAVLLRTGYRQAEDARLLIYPVRRAKWSPESWLFQAARTVVPCPNGKLRSGRVVMEADSINEVPTFEDARLRKHIDRRALNWYLSSGSTPKTFVGWCDESGCLQCYAIGIPWQKYGQKALVIIDYAAFNPAAEAQLDELVALLASEPDEVGLPRDLNLVIWPVEEGTRERRSPFSVKYGSKLFYRLPSQWSGAERVCVPFEGDKAFI